MLKKHSQLLNNRAADLIKFLGVFLPKLKKKEIEKFVFYDVAFDSIKI